MKGLLISSKLSQALITKTMSKIFYNSSKQNLTFESKEQVGSTFSFFVRDFNFENQSQNNLDDSWASDNLQTNQGFIHDQEKYVLQPRTLKQLKASNKNVQFVQPFRNCLIVDDDNFNLLALEMLLKKLNLTCDKAYNGEEAINKLVEVYSNQSTFYQIIFMDFQMPVMDGITATIQIQSLVEQKILPQIPIIACTAFNNKSDMEKCYQAGMQDFVSKPISQKSISKIIEKWIS